MMKTIATMMIKIQVMKMEILLEPTSNKLMVELLRIYGREFCSDAKIPLLKRRKESMVKEKAMLAEAQEALDEDQLAFLADPGILASQA
ncbi:hypothetical protein Tco_0177940 [Tanacetum coccineum]